MTQAPFFQEAPVLGNQYDEDLVLRSYLSKVFPKDIFQEVKSDLHRMGQRAVTDIYRMGQNAESEEPRLVQYDPWGRRIDWIETAPGWKELDQAAAEEGLIAIGYERKFSELSRIYQFAKLYLYSASSAIYTCPLAMTDGAARLIELHGDEDLKERAFKHLTSRLPDKFWTSGQWMTERRGGSDVSRTETVARHLGGDRYELNGVKWFTSATTSQMTMTLARIMDQNGKMIEGNRGLSLFYLETRKATGELNGLKIHRLKTKLGTRALPTAELSLEGTEAKLVSEVGQGVKVIASLFNVTRIYNSVAALAGMRRAIALARDYATRRMAFGKKLIDHPLHAATLARLEVEFRGAFHLTFALVEAMGKVECGKASPEDEAFLRILTPVAKLYTAKQGISIASEVLECFGGAGYIEDTGLPKLLRDAQVLSIWEGTTNVLSLDVLRAIERDGVIEIFMQGLAQKLSNVRSERLASAVAKVRDAYGLLANYLRLLAGQDRSLTEAQARNLAFSLARTFTAAVLIEHAEWSIKHQADPLAEITVKKWLEQDLVPVVGCESSDLGGTRALALG